MRIVPLAPYGLGQSFHQNSRIRCLLIPGFSAISGFPRKCKSSQLLAS
jgi:hypothetical protein